MTIAGTGWSARLFGRRWWPLWLGALALGAILLTDWFEVRLLAALVLFFLPGWAWLEACWPGAGQGVWRLLVAAGLGLALTSLGTLYLAYLPGPLTVTHLLLGYVVITLPALVLARRRPLSRLEWPDREGWLLILAVLGVAAALRMPHLGYAEFHEDEVEVTSLAVRAIQGEDYAVFLHRKGPAQMLLPLAGWLLSDRITEGWARLPFALASLLGVLTLAWLALRLVGPAAGVTAGLLLALNGYLVAFGRMVQYQVLIFFLASLAVACLWRVWEEGRPALVWPAALSLAVSLLAHYDALVYLPAGAYLSWRIWQRWPALRRTLLAAGMVALALLLSFYIPYVRDPQFELTRTYLAESRVGTEWLYNNLRVLKRLDADYSSRFYLPALWLLSLAVLVRYRPSPRAWWPVIGVALAAAWTTLRWPGLWDIGWLNLALAPWLVLLVGGAIGLRQRCPGYEVWWLWWGVPLLAYLFLVDDPRTHVYVAYPGWAVVAGLGAAAVWQALAKRPSLAPLRALLLAAAGLLALLVAGYQALIYLPAESTWQNLYVHWSGTPGELVYGDLPKPRSYFGYPRHVGWKAAGWLMDTGQLPDDFRSTGEDFSVPIWYAFETPRSCYSDPEVYLIGQPLSDLDEDARDRLAAGYDHAATVYTEGQPRLALFVRGEPGGGMPGQVDSADLEPGFDRVASPDHFAQGGEPDHPLEARFGDVARLVGYGLSAQSRTSDWSAEEGVRGSQVRPGETLAVYLYWEALAETDVAYRAFVHLGEDPVWGQHDDDPACRLPTSLWRAGMQTRGQFRVVPSPQTPAGEYPLVVGLYHPVTGERLPVLDAQGQPLGDSLTLTTIWVVE